MRPFLHGVAVKRFWQTILLLVWSATASHAAHWLSPNDPRTGAVLGPPPVAAPLSAALDAKDIRSIEPDDQRALPTRLAQMPSLADVQEPPRQPATAESAHPIALTTGPQRLAYDSLIHQARQHRGAVAAWDLGDRTRVKGFGVGPDTAHDYTRLAGQASDAYRLSGLLVEHALQAPHRHTVNLRLGWISGLEPVERARARRSAGWSVAGDTALLSERLRLRAEYATSSVISRTAAGAGSDGDAAYRLGLELRAQPGAPVDWHLGSEFSEVDPRFRSIGNPSTQRDRAQFKTYGGARLGDWRLELGLLRRRDNLEGDPSRPVVVSDRVKAATNWTPAQPAVTQIVGSPKYKLTAEIGGSRKMPARDRATDHAERRRSFKLSLGSEFSQPDLRWGMLAKAGVAPGTIGDVESPAIQALAFEIYGDLGGGWGLPVKPTLSWQRRHDATSDAADERWRAKLASPSIDLRHDLRGGFDMAFEHRDRSDMDRDALTTDLGARLVWTVQRPSSTRRGLALAVAASLAGNEAAPNSETDYRLMLSLSTDESLGGW